MVFLFEWSWNDIAQECEEFLGPKGFKAIHVSPPMEHIQGPQWWTRYQPVSYILQSRSGNEQEFQSMVQRCAAVGVGIYVDSVFNHCAANSGVGVAGSQYGDRTFPMYQPEDFHHDQGNVHTNCGVSNYQDRHNVQYCDLVGLPDLCTSCSKVQDTVTGYLNHLLELGAVGFRVDAAKHQPADQLAQLLGKVQRNGDVPYVFQEVIGAASEPIKPTEYFNSGSVTEFNYLRNLDANFVPEGKLEYLNNFGESWGMIPRDKAVVFLDNQDTQRGESQLTYKNGPLYFLANVFMLAHPYGYPRVMSSYYFNDHDQGPPGVPVHGPNGALNCNDGKNWVCEHRNPYVANMIQWRKQAGTSQLSQFTASSDGNGIAFCRGSTACVALNRGSSTWNVNLHFSLPAGDYTNVLCAYDFQSCPKVTVASDGSVSLQVPSVGAVAFHVGAASSSLEEVIL